MSETDAAIFTAVIRVVVTTDVDDAAVVSYRVEEVAGDQDQVDDLVQRLVLLQICARRHITLQLCSVTFIALQRGRKTYF